VKIKEHFRNQYPGWKNVRYLEVSVMIFYKSETDFYFNLNHEESLSDAEGWIRKDHKINIYSGDDEENEEIGFIEVVLFNLKNFKGNDEAVFEAFDEEGETYNLYKLIDEEIELPSCCFRSLHHRIRLHLAGKLGCNLIWSLSHYLGQLKAWKSIIPHVGLRRDLHKLHNLFHFHFN
jgi:hypothetical protein